MNETTRHGEIMESLGRIESKVDDARVRLDKHDQELDQIVEFQNNTKGGMKIITWVAGTGGAAAAFIAWAKGLLPPS